MTPRIGRPCSMSVMIGFMCCPVLRACPDAPLAMKARPATPSTTLQRIGPPLLDVRALASPEENPAVPRLSDRFLTTKML